MNGSLNGREETGLSWFGIMRLGLVQTALGAIVVLMTSTLNRIMVVEYGLAAMLPGALVGFHYAVQMSRPRWGYGSDVGGNRTRWIIGGMAVLAQGGALAALGTAWMATSLWAGIFVCVIAFALIGLGVGAAGTSLLTLLATKVTPKRRPAAASIVWIMMIAGFVLTAVLAGQQLDPYTPLRLVIVSSTVSVIAFFVALIAVWGIERSVPSQTEQGAMPAQKPKAGQFKATFKEVWAEPQARQFTIFVFVSMLAYSAQDLILEPFAGLVFGYAPGESTQLAGVQNGGVMAGMIVVAICGSALVSNRGIGRLLGSMRFWAVGGCLASALAFLGLALAAQAGPGWPLKANVFALGLANGAFAVAAIGSMMGLAGKGTGKREGTRMGLWGAAQAVAFGLGGFLGTVAIDVARVIASDAASAYQTIFLWEGALFVVSAVIAWRVAPGVSVGASDDVSSSPKTDDFASPHLSAAE